MPIQPYHFQATLISCPFPLSTYWIFAITFDLYMLYNSYLYAYTLFSIFRFHCTWILNVEFFFLAIFNWGGVKSHLSCFSGTFSGKSFIGNRFMGRRGFGNTLPVGFPMRFCFVISRNKLLFSKILNETKFYEMAQFKKRAKTQTSYAP